MTGSGSQSCAQGDTASAQRSGQWSWVIYLLAITAAELVVALWDARVGFGLHACILFAIMIQAALGTLAFRPLRIALLLVPLVRLSSLAVPVSVESPIAWYAATALPVLGAAVAAWRVLDYPRSLVGLRVGSLPAQVTIALIGIPIGVVEYYAFEPQRSQWPVSQFAFAIAVLVLVGAGFVLELVFRGIIQAAAAKVISSKAAIPFASALFAILHIPALTPASVLIGFVEGVVLGWIVGNTRSLMGVSLARGLANVLVVLVLPPLLGAAQPDPAAIVTPAPLIASPEASQAAPPTTPVQSPVAAAPPSPSTVDDRRPTVTTVTGAAPVAASSPSATPAPVTPAPAAATPAVTATPTAQAASAMPTPTATAASVAAAEPAPDPAAGVPPAPAEARQPSTEPVRQEDEFETYTVRAGDTLFAIARDRRTTVAALAQLNGIPNPNLILVGQVLRVPRIPNTP